MSAWMAKAPCYGTYSQGGQDAQPAGEVDPPPGSGLSFHQATAPGLLVTLMPGK